jgi:hypothetical protein
LAVGQQLWAKVTHRPVDAVAILGAIAASTVIVVNAVFLQSGAQPASFFANPPAVPQAAERTPNVATADSLKPTAAPPARNIVAERSLQPVAARRNDPIGDLIGASVSSSLRVAAVQRVLSAFGYRQIRPSGVLDEPTSVAIGKFESEHKLPVTGRLSERLLTELANMVGHPVE